MKFSSPASLKWFKSILLVIAVILLFCSSLCGYMIFVLRSNTIQMSGDLTRYIQENIDSRLMELYKYSSVLELHPTNSWLKKLTTAPDTVSGEVYRFSDQMLNYNYSNKLINGVFIYYPKIHQIVGSLGVYDAGSYYALDNVLLLSGYEEWLSKLTEESGSDFVFLQSDNRSQFCYIRKMHYNGRLAGYIVFELDGGELLNSSIMAQSREEPHSSLGMLLNGQLIAGSGDSAEIIKLAGLFPKKPDGPVILEEAGFLLYARPSGLSNLYYLNAYFHKRNLQPVYITLEICIFGIIACTVAGIFASLHISRKNTRPLVSLLDKIGGSPDETKDEYQAINRRFEQLIKDHNDNAEKVQEQHILIGSLFLKTILCTDMHSEYAIFSVAKRCDILFEHPRFLAAIAEPVLIKNQLDEGILLDITGYFESRDYEVIPSFHEGNIVMLFNIEENVTQEDISRQLEEMRKAVMKEERWNIALGLSYDGLVNIQYSYAQAATALHYGSKGEGTIVCYNNYMENIPSGGLSYLDAFENFSQKMIQKDYSNALVLLPAVFDNYFSKEDSFEITKVKTKAIQNLLLNARLKAKQDIRKPKCRIHTAQILSCSSLPQLREYTEAILKDLAEGPLKDSKNSVPQVAERARNIIQRDFTDPMLGLYLISAELNVSDSYLSTAFKNAFGIGVVQYINSLRIDKAKNLICNTDLSIREIALAVGFSSDASFIRVFKRYEMQTPSTLRKSRR